MRLGRTREGKAATRLFPAALGAAVFVLAAVGAAHLGYAGVCCIDDYCEDVTEVECQNQAGEYHGDGTLCETISCTSGVPYFREYDPTQPPQILTDPPVRYICLSPYFDLDAPPGGTTLAFYRISSQAGLPDPGFEDVMIARDGTVMADPMMWAGADCAQGSACCMGGTICHLARDQAHCEAMGGTYPGDGIDCASANCDIQSGACCESVGNCIDTDQGGCVGEYMGDGTLCGDFQCIGACCLPDDSCVETAGPAECQAQGGVFEGDGTDCASAPCGQAGACCEGLDTCVEVRAVDCTGDFQGSGTECDDYTCSGACCFPDETCALTPGPIGCTFQGGSFQGDGTDCATADCSLPGACCEAVGVCSEGPPSQCMGQFKGPGTSCVDFLCLGACCLPDETCATTMGLVDCAALGGDWRGDGTNCAIEDCTIPTGACCDVFGNCTEEKELDCLAAGGLYQGDGTDCGSVNCLDLPGACCEGLGVCVEEAASLCLGDFKGIGTNCADFCCSGACCLPDESCTMTSGIADCEALNGQFEGDCTDCAGVDCRNPVGACCDQFGGCSEETQWTCEGTPGSRYMGDGTDCTTVDCTDLPGACCEGVGVCVEVLFSQCVGEFLGVGILCADVQCSGACCLPDETCVTTSGALECNALNGTFMSDGTTCAGVDCTINTGACCLPGRVCVMETETNCVNVLGGQFMGDGTDCLTTDCPP